MQIQKENKAIVQFILNTSKTCIALIKRNTCYCMDNDDAICYTCLQKLAELICLILCPNPKRKLNNSSIYTEDIFLFLFF